MVSTLSLVAAGFLLGQTPDTPAFTPTPATPKVYYFNNGALVPANDAPRTGLFGRRDGSEPNRPILTKIQGWFKRGNDPKPVVSTPEPPTLAPLQVMPSVQGNPAELPKKLPTAPQNFAPKADIQIIPQKGADTPGKNDPLPVPQKSGAASKPNALTPASLTQTPTSAKTPILPANVNRIGRDDKFAWVTGQLEIEKGRYVLYYATPETVDTYHGHIVLMPQQVDMQSFQSGDLISVHGHLGSRGGSTIYYLSDANMIDRAK